MAPVRIMARDGWITPFPSSPSVRLIVPRGGFAANLRSSGVGVTADYVSRMQEGWETAMLELLDAIFAGSWTQKALFAEIARVNSLKGFRIAIWPVVYHPENMDLTKNETAAIDMFLNAQETAINPLITGPSKLKDPLNNIVGDGDNSAVFFDPFAWSSNSFVKQLAQEIAPDNYSGAGMAAEDVLFHEMVHAVRSMNGANDRTPTKNPALYSVEEFVAGLITNIAMSEKNSNTPLRYGEINFKTMPPAYATSKGFLSDAEQKSLVERVHHQNTPLCDKIAMSNVCHPFNPIRRLKRGQLWQGAYADW